MILGAAETVNNSVTNVMFYRMNFDAKKQKSMKMYGKTNEVKFG